MPYAENKDWPKYQISIDSVLMTESLKYDPPKM